MIHLSGLDIALILAAIIGSVAIGVIFTGRQTSMNSFFLGSKGMSGWLLGFSMTATMISAMSFLATPGYAFADDYRYLYPSLIMVATGVFAMYFVVPLFRKVATPSGYAYLEQRYGTWARLYAAFGFLIFNYVRLGVVLYATALALSVVLGMNLLTLILIMGVVSTIYTMAGGFEAVIWSELFQFVILLVGAAVLVPWVLGLIPGGASTVFDMGWDAGKFSGGSTEWSLTDKTIWVMLISNLFSTLAEYATRQDYIQRYRAAKSLNHARLAILLGALTIIPMWGYFHFLGTSLWAYYQINPDPAVAEMLVQSTPEKIVPYFISTQLPNGLRGLVLGGILMATLSTLAPILNSCSVTWMGDFYQRLIARRKSDRHYLLMSRVSTVAVGCLTMLLAWLIHALRSDTLQDFNYVLALVVSAGMLGLFCVGFFSTRVGGKAAGIAMALTVALMLVWLALGSQWVQARVPALKGHVPSLLWACVFSNSFFIVSALILGRFFPKPTCDLGSVTYQGVRAQIRAQEEASQANDARAGKSAG